MGQGYPYLWKTNQGGVTTLKNKFLSVIRNPNLNLVINLLMLLLNGGACVSQFLVGNFVLANILLMSTFSCVTAVLYWVFVVYDNRRKSSRD
jgi:hypothetical protein